MWRNTLLALTLTACAAPPPPTVSPTAVATPTPTPTAQPTATATVVTPPTAAATQPARHPVVIISIDGLRPDAIGLAPMPVLEALAAGGAASYTAQTVVPSVTLPAHTSLLSGRPPSMHGVTWNDYEPERGFIGSQQVPTLFTLAHSAGLRSLAVVGKEKLAHFNVPGVIDTYLYATEGDRDVVDQAIAALKRPYDFIFVHLPNTDYFGHNAGWMSETYLFQLTRTDEHLARLLGALPENSYVIVTADHGGLDTSHGADLPENRTIPWILAGPEVRAGLTLSEPISVMDTAATAAFLLGLRVEGGEGRVVCEALNATAVCGPPSAVAVPASVNIDTSVRLLFTGDINPGRCVAERSLEANDFTLPFREVAQVLRAADVTVGSLDGALSDLSPPIACRRLDEYNLIGPTRAVEGLVAAGFDVITVATNHILDCGSYGFGCDSRTLIDTLATLNGEGILPVGAGVNEAAARAPVVVERNGQAIVFLALTAVVPSTWAGPDWAGAASLSAAHLPDVLASIQAARAEADAVVVLVHWGVEYAPEPSAEQRDWTRQMRAAGASLIIGNHPHVIQPIEPDGDGLIAYSLGNFVFDQEPPDTRRGLVLEVTLEAGAVADWRTLPVRIERLFQPVWETP